MIDKYQIFLVSDSTGETLDRIFTAIKAQFENFNYYSQQFSFTRTQNQIINILEDAKAQQAKNVETNPHKTKNSFSSANHSNYIIKTNH